MATPVLKLVVSVAVMTLTWTLTRGQGESAVRVVRKVAPVDSCLVSTDLMWAREVDTVMDCARLCVGNTLCTSFLLELNGLCHAYGAQWLSDNTHTVHVLDSARYYMTMDPTGVERVPLLGSSVQPQSQWLFSACKDGCPVDNSICFGGQCLCQPGFFFSHTTDTCISNCSGLGQSFLEYRERMLLNAQDLVLKTDASFCACACLARSSCASFSFRLRIQKCHLSEGTALTQSASFITTLEPKYTISYFQRSCSLP